MALADLATDVLLQLCLWVDGPALHWACGATRRVIPPLATDDEAVRLGREGGRHCHTVAPVDARLGRLAVVGGRTVRRDGPQTTPDVLDAVAEGRWVDAVFAADSAVRAVRPGAPAAVATLLRELVATAPPGRRRTARLFGHLLSPALPSAEETMKAVAQQFCDVGARADVVVAGEALSWGLSPTAWRQMLTTLTSAPVPTADRPGVWLAELDERAAEIVAMVDGWPMWAYEPFRDLMVRNCVETNLPRALGAVLDAAAAPVAAVLWAAATAPHHRRPMALKECLLRVPADEDLGHVLRCAAETNDVASCRLVLARWSPAGAVGAALVAAARHNHAQAVDLLAGRDPPQASVDAGLEAAAHWGYVGVVAALLNCNPSLSAVCQAVWSSAFRDDAVVVRALRRHLALSWGQGRESHDRVQQAVDRALQAAASGSGRAARALLEGSGPSPSAAVQGDVLRRACAAGDDAVIEALLSEPLTRTMNRLTLNSCFLHSARRQDLTSVRVMLPMVRPQVAGEALKLVMCARDADLTHLLLGAVERVAVHAAVYAAFGAGATETLTMATENCRPSHAAAVDDALAAATTAAAVDGRLCGPAVPAVRSLLAALQTGSRFLERPGVWRRALTALSTLQLDQELVRLVARHHGEMDDDDMEAVRSAVMRAIRSGSSSTLMVLRPAFVFAAQSKDVDAAFMLAVAHRSVVSLQLLGRDFVPTRDSLRRCHLLLQDTSPGWRTDALETVLSRMCRRRPLRPLQ
jgi:hypothetical protein